MIAQVQSSMSENGVFIISTGGSSSGGVPGLTGVQGAAGAQGYQGRQGVTGAGPQGTLGSQGYQGWQGYQGLGSQGPAGFPGGTGSQGYQGVLGYQGARGTTGFQGASGSGYGVNAVTASGAVVYARTASATFDDVDSMSVTLNTTAAGAAIVCFFTVNLTPTNSNNYHALFRFVLDGATFSPSLVGVKRDTPPATGEQTTVTLHYSYVNLDSGTHTVKVQVSNDSTSQSLTVGNRMLTGTWSG